ncbi:MAG: ABC transporter permease [Myxococcota bacterium]
MSVVHILQESLVFLPLTLGMHLSYAVLGIADLTVDGSFVLGAAVCARCMHAGWPAWAATAAAITAGGLAGVAVALIQRRNRISPLLAGILALFILQSVNLQVMGRPNLPLLNHSTLLTQLMDLLGLRAWGSWAYALALLPLLIVLAALYTALLQSPIGLWLRAMGCQQQAVSLMGKDPERLRMLGLACSNALVACAGLLTAQLNGYADVGMGTGSVLLGIATVVIAQQLLTAIRPGRVWGAAWQTAACFVAVCVYFCSVHLFVAVGLSPHWLKMAIGLGLIAFLRVHRLRREP